MRQGKVKIMEPFDPREPIIILRTAVYHLDAIRWIILRAAVDQVDAIQFVKSADDYYPHSTALKGNDCLPRLLNLRTVFINVAYKEGIPKLDALKVFERLEIETSKVLGPVNV